MSFTFRFNIGGVAYTFKATKEEHSIANGVANILPGCSLALHYESSLGCEDDCTDTCCTERKGHYVDLDKWECDNEQQSWLGKMVHYHVPLFIEIPAKKKGYPTFEHYFDKKYLN